MEKHIKMPKKEYTIWYDILGEKMRNMIDETDNQRQDSEHGNTPDTSEKDD